MSAVRGCPVLIDYDPVDPNVMDDMATWMSVARAGAPIFYIPRIDEWVATRISDCERILGDPETFSNRNTVQLPDPPPQVADELPRGFAMRETFGGQDPPEHSRLRRRIQPAFARRQALGKAGLIRGITDRLLDDIIDRGTADFATEWCGQIPSRVMSHILGFPEADAKQTHRWAVDLVRLFASSHLGDGERLTLARGQVAFERYVEAIVADRRANPRDEDDFITNLLIAPADETGAPLSDREVVVVVLNAIFAGSDTSASALSAILHQLLQDRRQWEALVACRSGLDLVIEEGLRLRGPVFGTVRTATREVDVGGVTLPEGAIIRVHVWSANHDDKRFEDPLRFDPQRSNVRQHLAFGRGAHTCPGQHLARLEIKVALETLLDRLPSLRLVPGHKLQIPPHMIQEVVVGGLVVEWDDRSLG